MELLYGTTNEGKLLVMRRALSPLGITVIGLKGIEKIPVVQETGSSPLENARLKANAYFKAFQCDLLEYLSQRAVISEVFCDGVG